MQWFASIFIACALSTFASAAPAPQASQSSSLVAVLFPNYIVPVKQSSPDTAFGTQYEGNVEYVSDSARNETTLYVSFYVPSNGAFKCFIKFTLPTKDSDPNGFKWKVTGTGELSVYALNGYFNDKTLTWNNRPGRSPPGVLFKITQPISGGNAVVDGEGITCFPNRRIDFEISVTRTGPSTFNWFELDNPLSGITLEMHV